jgi:hypothetical protein
MNAAVAAARATLCPSVLGIPSMKVPCAQLMSSLACRVSILSARDRLTDIETLLGICGIELFNELD